MNHDRLLKLDEIARKLVSIDGAVESVACVESTNNAAKVIRDCALNLVAESYAIAADSTK